MRWGQVFRFEHQIRDGKFQVVLFDKTDLFAFPIVIPDKINNVASNIVCSATGVESLMVARATNNPKSFSTATKRLIQKIGSVF